MKMRNLRAILLGAVALVGGACLSSGGAQAQTCNVSYINDGALAGYYGTDNIAYFETMAIVVPRPQNGCTQGHVNATLPCIDWNQGAAQAVAERRRVLETGQTVTLTHSAPGGTFPNFVQYVFGTSQCIYSGMGTSMLGGNAVTVTGTSKGPMSPNGLQFGSRVIYGGARPGAPGGGSIFSGPNSHDSTLSDGR